VVYKDVIDIKPSIYIVKKGDSLYKIAKLFNTNIINLITLNKLKDTKLYPGQILIIE